MKNKKAILTVSYAIILILGLLLTINSADLAEVKSRNYVSSSAYSTSADDINRNTIPIAATGCVISLIAGFGLIITINKDK